MASQEKRIVELQKRVDDLAARMEAGRERILESAAGFCSGWWEDEARRVLRATPQVSDETVAGLKADVAALAAAADTVVARLLDHPGLWPHRGDHRSRLWIDPHPDGDAHPGVGRALDPAMRRALAGVLPLFYRHGLRPVGRAGRVVTDRYPHGVEYPEGLIEDARSYRDLAAELREAAGELEALRVGEAEAGVDERWASA